MPGNLLAFVGHTITGSRVVLRLCVGKQVTRLSVATNKRFKDDAGEWQSRATWHNVVVYGPSADYAARIQPGSLVFVEREISYGEYEREIETAKGSVTVKWPIVELVASSINAITPKAEKGVAA